MFHYIAKSFSVVYFRINEIEEGGAAEDVEMDLRSNHSYTGVHHVVQKSYIKILDQ